MKLDSPDNHCISIGAFWENDTDHGIGIVMQPKEGHNLDQMVTLIENTKQAYRENNYDPILMMQELKDIAQQSHQNKGELTQFDRFTVLTYVAYLQDLKVIPCDHFNGMQYATVMGNKVLH